MRTRKDAALTISTDRSRFVRKPGSVERVADYIGTYRRAGIDILQVVALTETDEDRKLRPRLVAELRR